MPQLLSYVCDGLAMAFVVTCYIWFLKRRLKMNAAQEKIRTTEKRQFERRLSTQRNVARRMKNALWDAAQDNALELSIEERESAKKEEGSSVYVIWQEDPGVVRKMDTLAVIRIKAFPTDDPLFPAEIRVAIGDNWKYDDETLRCFGISEAEVRKCIDFLSSFVRNYQRPGARASS